MPSPTPLPITVLANALKQSAGNVNVDYTGKDILRSLRYHGITELSYKQFENKPKLHNALDALTKESIAVEMARSVEIEKFLKAFHSANVDFIVFKGTALAYSLYQNAWQRPRSDTDILIERSSLQETLKIFQQLGYEKSVGISGDYVSYQTTVTRSVSPNFVHRVDIHWRINNRQILADCYSLEELLQNSKSIALLNQQMRIPSLVDSLILACVHRVGHHADKERIIWVHDIHLLSESLSHEQWAALIAKARKKNVSRLVFDGISTSIALLDTKIEKGIYNALKKSLNSKEASSIFLDRELSNFQLFCKDTLFLPKWSQRLTLLKEHLIPDREYLTAKTPSLSYGKAVITRLLKRKPSSKES